MQINLKTSFGIDDTLHVPRVFVIHILWCVFTAVGNETQITTRITMNERERKKTLVVSLLLLMSHAEWHGNFCIFDDELECSLKCLCVVPVSINLEKRRM